MTDQWEEVGIIGVDAGLCWIGDPCYCVTPDAEEHPAPTWGDFCELVNNDAQHTQFSYAAGHPGLGVCVSTGYGDGTYPVFIKRNSEGVVVEAKVVFAQD